MRARGGRRKKEASRTTAHPKRRGSRQLRRQRHRLQRDQIERLALLGGVSEHLSSPNRFAAVSEGTPAMWRSRVATRLGRATTTPERVVTGERTVEVTRGSHASPDDDRHRPRERGGSELRVSWCARCFGTGRSGKHKCKACGGKGTTTDCPNARSHKPKLFQFWTTFTQAGSLRASRSRLHSALREAHIEPGPCALQLVAAG